MAVAARLVSRSPPCSVHPSPAASTSPSPSHWSTSSPPTHFSRHLEAKLDLSFVREWARELYADRGRPSIDPVVFFTLQLVMVLEDIRSERQLIETASLNLAHRVLPGLCPRRGLTRPLQPDPHPATARWSTSSSASLRRSSICARRQGSCGVESCTSTPPRSRPTPASRHSSHASPTKRRLTWPNYSRTRPVTVHWTPKPICLSESCRCRSPPSACLQPAIHRGVAVVGEEQRLDDRSRHPTRRDHTWHFRASDDEVREERRLLVDVGRAVGQDAVCPREQPVGDADPGDLAGVG